MSIAAYRRTLITELTIPGNPVPKARPRVGRHGAMTPLRTVNAELKVGWAVKEALVGYGGPDDAPYAVEARFFENRYPSQQADADNCQKLIGDALNGIVWLDDIQIVEWFVTIERGVNRPRTELVIYRLGTA